MRLPDVEDGTLHLDAAMPGDYWLETRTGEWWIRDPIGHFGRIGKHTVVENADGTITVTPSILQEYPGGEGYHGWLTNGEWNPPVRESEGS